MEIKLLSGALGAEIKGINLKDTSDENFKKNAMDGLIEVEFSLKEDGELFIHEEGFVKDNDGQTELFVD